MKHFNLASRDIATYFLSKSQEDGDFISNLKMQKLVYYAYCWALTLNSGRLFEERLQAWPNGPVSAELYRQLSKYGFKPIGKEFITDKSLEAVKTLDTPTNYTLESVYKSYMPMAAFELVALTHNELPWKKARTGLGDTDASNIELEDEDIIEYFSKL